MTQAEAGFLPKFTGVADLGYQRYSDQSAYGSSPTAKTPGSVGVQLTHTIFNGGRTSAAVRQAGFNIAAAREALRNAEQSTLFDCVVAYMDVLRDNALFELSQNNVEVISDYLRLTRERFGFGDVTETDVAQSRERLAGAQAQASAAGAQLRVSMARYRQITGADPVKLSPARPADNLVPANLDAALRTALDNHPAIRMAMANVEAAAVQVSIIDAEHLPTIGLSGSVLQRYDLIGEAKGEVAASIFGQLSVPLYDGGSISSRTRQAREIAGQRRLDQDTVRDQVRTAVIASWAQLEAAKARVSAGEAQVEAARSALSGVRQETQIGQRTTLDLLNAEQTVVTARSRLIEVQRDRVIASYAVAQATGQLYLPKVPREGSGRQVEVTLPESIQVHSPAQQRRATLRSHAVAQPPAPAIEGLHLHIALRTTLQPRLNDPTRPAAARASVTTE